MDAKEEAQAKKLAQMQAAQEGEMRKAEEQKQRQQEMEERKRIMIRQLLEPDALERLNRIGLVKPEKQMQMEAFILQTAQSGMVQEKISEAQLVSMLEKLDGTKTAPSVKIQRKRRDDDDDDIDLDNL
mmetsp:Transcript_63284/g.150943  ORF Transcript_63284/g.150943 Transcript_63284/m.150943 type:complete len:128 (-) Transcript_63284:102-485(-)|eukprot:CAMPEP_0178400466 /NCGR_PEP_ID=MMETSP0689_2-20121128/15804_1 /TAXON_ID=160604 /ORGANISM="Amphidinium massartii, Strain CS-259" /LENGTH=127 /DNA_ID=CAMNT_0020021263 /DNA_START=94 /DNA_END=477 /DNA_ORIENTATION=+